MSMGLVDKGNGFRNPFLAGIPVKGYYLIVFFASILVTTLFLVFLPKEWSVNESSDFTSFYEPVARNILSGNGYTKTGSFIETFYPPGYPLILASQFAITRALDLPEQLVLQIFSVFFTALSVLFLFDLARRFSDTKSAILVVFVWMTYPFLLWLTKQPNSELAFMAMLFGACDLFFSIWDGSPKKNFLFIAAGCLFGFSMLIRPIAIYYPIALVIALFLTQKKTLFLTKLSKSGLLFLGIIIAVLPWEIYAYSHTGNVLLLSNNDSMAMRGGLVFAVSDDSYKQAIIVPDDVRSLMLDIKSRYADLNSTSKILDYLKSQFIEKPGIVLELFGIKALRSWYATDSQRLEKYILIIQIPYLLIILIGSWFSWKKEGRARSLLIGIWLLAICNWTMNIAVTSTLRYMVPIIGLLFVNLAQIPLFFSERNPSRVKSKTITSTEH